jgi:hypothetical protein
MAEGGKAVVFEHSKAEIQAMMQEAADREFMKLGVQYYVAARSAVMARLLPVCGNLYHHSLEMFLKAGLSRSLPLRDLQNRFGHKLPKISTAFKAQFSPAGQLDDFDETITKLHQFDDIRYPDKVLTLGAQMIVEWAAAPVPGTGGFSPAPPLYGLNVNDLDRLVAKIFEASSRNPLFFTSYLAGFPHAREIIRRDNPAAAQLLPPQG